MSQLDILLPHYNDPAGLALSLESIAEQTWTGDMRLVIVDDGSEPKHFARAEALVAEQPLPALVLRNPKNRGRPYTRNRLLDSIDSPHVAWLDAGDVWYPAKLEKQFEHMSRLRYQGEDTDRIWITCHYDWQWAGRRARAVEQQVDGRQLRELMLGQRLRAYLWTLLGTATAFRGAGRFDEELPRLQDLDYFARFVQVGGVITVPPDTAALCRYHKSDIGRDAREIRRCNARIQEKYRPALEAYGPAFLKTIRFNADALSARFAGNNGARGLRYYYLARALGAHPRRAMGATGRWLIRRTEQD
jgi:glycosyltransferase involved in cell wall biosynthesis